MSDDRPAEDPIEAIARLSGELHDLRTTLTAKIARRPTGDIEPTLRSVAKADTLLMQGQTVLRSAYPILWQWVQEQGLSPTIFGAGDGTTTFVLPNFQGRFVLGAGTLSPDTYALGAQAGASTKTLTTANMPAHDHNVGVNGVGDHGHNFGTNNSGGHGGHFPGESYMAAGGTLLGLAAWNSGGVGGGGHTHSGGVDLSGNHTHGVNETAVGSGTAFNAMPPYIAINWLIWT